MMGGESMTSDVYKGYKLLSGSVDEINEYMENINAQSWHTNEYLIIQNTDDHSEKEMRWDGEKFVGLKLPPSRYIKGKNALQRCALDMLNNQEITVCSILGNYGSGKTYLGIQMALYAVKEKGWQSHILGVREPLGEGRELGYLPGDFEAKNGVWTLPLVQQLDGKEWEVEQLKQQGILDFNIPTYMKGTSYADTWIVVDEAEDLSEKQIRLIGTRVGSNSKIVFDGDYRQTATNTSGSPLLKMCNALKGNQLFACITLEEDVRSETSRLFANLFQ